MKVAEQSIRENVSLPASLCNHCQITWYPQRIRCPKCLDGSLGNTVLPKRGVLNSFTVVRVGRPGDEVPYSVAVADFGQVRVFARLCNWDKAKIGEEVSVISMTLQSDSEDDAAANSKESYMFSPVSSEGR